MVKMRAPSVPIALITLCLAGCCGNCGGEEVGYTTLETDMTWDVALAGTARPSLSACQVIDGRKGSNDSDLNVAAKVECAEGTYSLQTSMPGAPGTSELIDPYFRLVYRRSGDDSGESAPLTETTGSLQYTVTADDAIMADLSVRVTIVDSYRYPDLNGTYLDVSLIGDGEFWSEDHTRCEL